MGNELFEKCKEKCKDKKNFEELEVGLELLDWM